MLTTYFALALLQGCSNHASNEDLARLEGRVQSIEQRLGVSGTTTTSSTSTTSRTKGGQGQGGQGQGGPGGQGGQGGQTEGGQGGQAAEGQAAEGEVSAEMLAMEKALAEGMDAMNSGDLATAKSKLAEVGTKYPDAKGAETAKLILGELELVGASAPALATDSWLQGNGNLTTGSATLLVFFNTDNKNSESVLGRIQQLSQGPAKAKGLNVLGMTRASETMSADALKEWVTGKGISFPVALDKAGATHSAYKRSAPVSAVIVKAGKVVWTGNPARMTDEGLAKYL